MRALLASGDWILASGLAAVFALEIWVLGNVPDDPPESLGRALTIASGVVLIASVGWRRRAPITVLPPALAWEALSGSPLEGWTTPVVALVVATYTLGSATRGTLAGVSVIGVAALVTTVAFRHPEALTDPGDLVIAALILGGPWLAGLAIRKRQDRVAALERRALKFERLRDQETRAAVADERARIARELHDMVAHAMSVIVLQARGGRRSLSADPAATKDALDAIERSGAEALAEMRRLLGVFRAQSDAAELAPRPSLRHLDLLVGQVRDAGLPIQVTVEGEAVELPPGVDVSAYRILQEALTNSLRHAGPASARVVVRYGPETLDLEVVDTGTGSRTAADGHGLVGMRERVGLFGGTLEAGPQAQGGFAVRARLPLEEPPE
jgi:signal transduction histidine kinase